MSAVIAIRLSDADRARLGLDQEWIQLDLFAVTAREAMALQRGADLGDGLVVQFDGPNAYRTALGGKPVFGADGQPVMVEEPDPDGPEGATTLVQKRAPDFGAELATVWLGLRRAGITVPLAEVDFDRDGWEWRWVHDDTAAAEGDGEPGKDEAPDQSTPPTTSQT